MKDPAFALELAAPRLRRPWYHVSVRRAVGLVFALGCVFGLLSWLSRAVWEAREAARRAQCVCNFCQITLALHNYHDAYGSFPPAHVDDAQGRRMHSWRVLILPFMEQSPLYNTYNLNEPWNSPGNRTLLNAMPNVYACPSRHDNRSTPTTLTSYVAITGPGTAFPDGRTVKLSDVKDGAANTIIAAEVANLDVPWTEPRDLDVRTMSLKVNDPNRGGISSRHPGGANVTSADGGKRFMREGITPQDMKAILTIDGRETVDVDKALSHR